MNIVKMLVTAGAAAGAIVLGPSLDQTPEASRK